MITDKLACNWGQTSFLIFSDNIFSSLIYYSHVFSLVAALIIGSYLFFKNPKAILSQIFFSITIAFGVWVFSDLVLWADDLPHYIMFFWSLTILFEPIIYALCLYFVIVFLSKVDATINEKIGIFLMLIPTFLLTTTKYAILGFNYTNCNREVVEGVLVYYGYIVEVVFVLWMVILLTRAIKKRVLGERQEIILFGLGIIFFLLAFSWGNIVGSLTDNWTIAQYGLFGMPVFLAFLSYLIVKYRVFNIKVIGTQALVTAQIILLLSLLFIQSIENARWIVGITLVIFIFLGIYLVRSVRKEIEQRERIEILASDLKIANTRLLELDKQKSEFVSFATHQLRAPLTAMKGYSSLILEGELGATTPEIKQAVGRIYDSSNTLTNIVDDYLNISRIELGTMKYSFDMLDLKELVEHVIGELKPNIEKKSLKFSFLPENTRFIVRADKDKLKQVIANLIDNSVKYTPSGSIVVSLSRDRAGRKILFSIKDTGVGISPEVMPKLFSKFVRADNANKQNIYGTGLGLYVAKDIVSAHKGKLWAESDGDGKGSTFFLELDMEV